MLKFRTRVLSLAHFHATMPGEHTYNLHPCYDSQVQCPRLSCGSTIAFKIRIHGQLDVKYQVLASVDGGGCASTPAGAQAPELAQPACATASGASGWASPASPDCGNSRSAAAQRPLSSDGGAPSRTHVPASDGGDGGASTPAGAQDA